MAPPRIIALCGLKRCGKDTVADHLVSKYGFTKVKIADPLKNLCKSLFNLTDDQLETDLKDQYVNELGTTPRKVMQFFGTEVMQFKVQELLPKIGRSFWIQKTITDMKLKPGNLFVIGDMRFMHEYNAINQAYGHDMMVIKIISNRACSINVDTHESEKEWEQIPAEVIIHNNGSITDLYETLDRVIHTL